jgi:hypothetical protein
VIFSKYGDLDQIRMWDKNPSTFPSALTLPGRTLSMRGPDRSCGTLVDACSTSDGLLARDWHSDEARTFEDASVEILVRFFGPFESLSLPTLVGEGI